VSRLAIGPGTIESRPPTQGSTSLGSTTLGSTSLGSTPLGSTSLGSTSLGSTPELTPNVSRPPTLGLRPIPNASRHQPKPQPRRRLV